MRQEVTSYQINLTGERATEHPRVFTAITMVHRLSGPELAEASVARALQLSITRYCPVYAMLGDSVDILVKYELTDETSGAVSAGEVVRTSEWARGSCSNGRRMAVSLLRHCRA